jgi:hypothetical protein
LGIKPTPILEVCLARAGLEILSQKFCCGRNLYYQTATYQTCSANLADTERNERQAFKRQQVSAAKSEMAYHNRFVLNSLGGNLKSAMPVRSLSLMSFPFLSLLCPNTQEPS